MAPKELTSIGVVNFVGLFFGKRDHSTVIHACKTTEDRVETDSGVAKTISNLKNPAQTVFLITHIGGIVNPEIIEIAKICKDNGVILIEDCAHALGAKWRGKLSGSFGQASCFSAQSYKMLDGGEGGLLVTDDEEIAAKSILYSGSYESSWKSHFGNDNPFLPKLQKKIPPFNFRFAGIPSVIM